MTRPKLLFLSHRLPYPPHNGAALRTFNILKQLARTFEITALCFDREDTATRYLPLQTRIGALRPFAELEVFPIAQQASRIRLAWDHIRSLLTVRPYTYYVHESRDYERCLKHYLSHQDWALVHLDSLDLLRFLQFLEPIPVVCTHHNVESALLRRRSLAEPSWLKAWYLRLQARLLERAERHALRRVALNVVVSDDDAAAFASMVPAAHIVVVPNGVDTEFFRPEDGTPREAKGCVFVGGTSWFPNKDGLQWFAEAILPELIRLNWASEVTWVGRATADEIEAYANAPGLRLTGYVEDIRPYVHQAACFIAPLRVGGGTRLKILDAWAMGRAVVSTTVGCEGLRTEPDKNILIADTPQAFASAVIKLLQDREVRERIGGNARATVEQHYSWDTIGQEMARTYLNIARNVSS